jgi:hypothetical protein
VQGIPCEERCPSLELDAALTLPGCLPNPVGCLGIEPSWHIPPGYSRLSAIAHTTRSYLSVGLGLYLPEDSNPNLVVQGHTSYRWTREVNTP